MNRQFPLLVLVCAIFTSASAAFAQVGYERVPNADARAAAQSGYKVVASFPRLELVVEGNGQPKPELTRSITNPTVAAKIAAGGFKSLQVRDLGVQHASYEPRVRTFSIPYVVSVKHSQGQAGGTLSMLANQGTIEAGGVILVQMTEIGKIHVTVTRFDDSQELERIGRKVGANAEINLEFANTIAKPVLESYFNADGARILELLTIAQADSATMTPLR